MRAMLYGLDWASHQGAIDFDQLRAEGHSFAIGKCTGESNYVNPTYAENHQRALRAGLVTGSYDWVEPQDPRDPEWLAADYLRCVESLGGRPPGHLLTVDFETPDWFKGSRGRGGVEDFMRRYLYTLRQLAGQPIIVYTAPYFLQETGGTGWGWLGRDFLYWMAAPGAGMVPDDAPWQTPLGPPWSRVTLHQHQWYARSGAIGSGANFDRNRFNGTLAELRAIGKPGATVVKNPITGSPSGDPHERIIAEIGQRLTLPQLGTVQGRGYVQVDGHEMPLVEFEKYRAVLNGDSVEGMFVDPQNPMSFAALDAAGKVRWG